MNSEIIASLRVRQALAGLWRRAGPWLPQSRDGPRMRRGAAPLPAPLFVDLALSSFL